MHICIFNPEHDLCLAKGRANYIPPRSAVQFALNDAATMQALYPDARCFSAYSPSLREGLPKATRITAWGWDAVVRHELLKRGADPALLPSDDDLATIRRLQHRSTVLPLQAEAWPVRSEEEAASLLREYCHLVLKAPWSGAGRGIRWVHGALTEIDRAWLAKTVKAQGMAIAERRRDVAADFALEYRIDGGRVVFAGYSMFSTGSGVYRDNLPLTDEAIEQEIIRLTLPHRPALAEKRAEVERWLLATVAPAYSGPVGIDLMVDLNRHIYVAEMNLRHTMGMVAHAKINNMPWIS